MRDDEPPLTPDLLMQAYRVGVFPMSEGRDDPEVFWVDPQMRGIFQLDEFHISRSLAKTLRSGRFQATANTDFASVVQGCAERPETWINDTIFGLYQTLHERGHAHSVEIWQDRQLVGGVYGVASGSAFFGESMFSRTTDASKVALAHLVDRLKSRGYRLFDTQFITDHLTSLGAKEIPRVEYHALLEAALSIHAEFGSAGPLSSGYDVLQRSAQTS